MNDEDVSSKIDRNCNPFVVEQVVGDGPDTRVRKISKHAMSGKRNRAQNIQAANGRYELR